MMEFSTNDRAERLFGRRPTDVVPCDMPCELGYWCPVCQVRPLQGDEFDERLTWSEYYCFLWCSVCNKDYPSALCVQPPLEDEHPDYVNAGIDDAIRVFLDTIETALDEDRQ